MGILTRIGSVLQPIPTYISGPGRYLAITLALSRIVLAATVINVPPSGDFQAALNSASPGDTIVLAAGATYIGNFVLPAKTGTGLITIRSSAASSLPPDGSRIQPSDAAYMAKLVTLTSVSALTAETRAHDYRITGLEITNAGSSIQANDLVRLGAYETSPADLPTSFLIDHLYIHGGPAGVKHGIALNGAQVQIRDSQISDMTSTTDETHAIAGWNGSGPYQILNNRLEATGIVILFGGGLSTANVVASDVQIQGNYLHKPLSFNNPSYLVKNLIELKKAQRVTLSGNILENDWPGGQWCMVISVYRDGNPGADVHDVKIIGNRFRNCTRGIDISGTEAPAYGITVQGNLLYDIPSTTLLLLGPLDNVSVDRNTIVTQSDMSLGFDMSPVTHLSVTNNVLYRGNYGVKGSGAAEGTATLTTFAPGAIFTGSVLVAANSLTYPPGNFYPLTLSLTGYKLPTGSYSAGPDIDALNASLAPVIDGRSSSITTVPSISIVSPTVASTYTTSSNTISLAGTAADAQGITQVSWTTDHGASGFATGTANWTISGLALPAGSTRVTVTARNLKGNQASAALVVSCEASNSFSVTITSPTSQPIFNATQNTIALAGTASATATRISWATDQGVQGQASGTTAWIADGIVLRSGSNEITVTAHDAADNQVSTRITIVFVAPFVAIESLPSALAGVPYSFKLTASGGLPPLKWSAEMTPEGLGVNEDGWISGTPLTTGIFTFNVAVRDSAQALTNASIHLEIDSGLLLRSAANLNPGPVAAESMVTAFGFQLATDTVSSTESAPPTVLLESTVVVQDAQATQRFAGLYYVSPSQINFLVPSGTAVGPALVTVQNGNGSRITGTIDIAGCAPGLFTLNDDGLVAAGLTRVKGTNSSYEPVARLDTTTNQFVAVPIDLSSDTDLISLTLYGTGLRSCPGLDAVQLRIGNVLLPVTYDGPSGVVDGLDIVNVQLPASLRGRGTTDILLQVNGVAANIVRVAIL